MPRISRQWRCPSNRGRFNTSRVERTIRISRVDYKDTVESILRANDIPTAFAEVQWWNNGLRTSNDITIEVIASAPIISWEIRPPQSDLSAGWNCSRDPKGLDADRTLIRISQAQLRPKGRCHLILGLAQPEGDGEVEVKAFFPDRDIPHYMSVGRWIAPLGLAFIVFAGYVAFKIGSLVIGGGEEMKNASTLQGLFVMGVVMATVGGCAWVIEAASKRIGHGMPTWRRVTPRRRS